MPAKAIESCGAPEHIRSDNSPEFIASTVRDVLADRGIHTPYIDSSSSWQNGYAESFNSRFRDERLKGEQLSRLTRPVSSSPTGSPSTMRKVNTAGRATSPPMKPLRGRGPSAPAYQNVR